MTAPSPEPDPPVVRDEPGLPAPVPRRLQQLADRYWQTAVTLAVLLAMLSALTALHLGERGSVLALAFAILSFRLVWLAWRQSERVRLARLGRAS